ncbi:MAG: hypothetical protein HXY53_07475 [Nitrospirae bacterium]|nr:hypothetical protein [Nitrospirota bacterium]
MLISVIFRDGKRGLITASLLEDLLMQKKIKKFLRLEGWVNVGVDPVRMPGRNNSYTGLERRNSSFHVYNIK